MKNNINNQDSINYSNDYINDYSNAPIASEKNEQKPAKAAYKKEISKNF